MINFNKEIKEMTQRALEEYDNAPLMKRTNDHRLNAIGNIYFLFILTHAPFIFLIKYRLVKFYPFTYNWCSASNNRIPI